MTQCIGVTRKGSLCQNVATGGSDYCPAHDPAREEARRRSASKAARSKKPHREVGDIKQRLTALVGLVLTGKLDRADAAVCGQLLNYVMRGVALQLKIKEHEEYEQRIAHLEELLEERERDYGVG